MPEYRCHNCGHVFDAADYTLMAKYTLCGRCFDRLESGQFLDAELIEFLKSWPDPYVGLLAEMWTRMHPCLKFLRPGLIAFLRKVRSQHLTDPERLQLYDALQRVMAPENFYDGVGKKPAPAEACSTIAAPSLTAAPEDKP